jgi:hypothetical protein
MTIDEHQTKSPPMFGLARHLRILAQEIKDQENFSLLTEEIEDICMYYQWATEVETIQAAITQVGEEE